MARSQPTEQLVRRAAHDLLRDIFDEVPLLNPNTLLPHLTQWVRQFTASYVDQHWRGSTLVQAASAVAELFYEQNLQQKHHLKEDQVELVFQLSQGLLIACGYYADKDDPVARFHSAHYQVLKDAAYRMTWEQGTRDRQYQHDHQFVMPYQVAFSSN